MPLSRGQVLNNRYRIVTLLAQGGFGAVYRAWDLNLKNAVALKENLTVSSESVKQFTLEARLLANLRQENLPYVIDYFSLPDQGQYLVMEFVEGDDLNSMLQKTSGPLPEAQIIPWIVQVCNALEYLHAQTPPVIHRDIKPANIKITTKGEVKLVDFGIAKVYDPSGRTTVGARAVTQGFSPPEQYGSGRTDARSDVYALGATLYALLTGETPLDSLQRRMGNALTSPRQFNAAISPALEQVVLQAMNLESGQRFQSVRAFKDALTASLMSAPVVQRHPEPVEKRPIAPTIQAAVGAPEWSSPMIDSGRRPASTASALPSVFPPAPASPVKKTLKFSTGMIAGILLCLVLVVFGLTGGYFLFYPAITATPSPTPRTATQTPIHTDLPARPTDTLPVPTATQLMIASPTPVISLSPTRVLTWTPIPSSTPTPGLVVATWYPCAGSYASRLQVGIRAYVSYDPPLPNRVRSQPNTSTSEILGMLEVGEKMDILEGPVCSGGWIWWRVSSLQKSLVGWTAEGDNNGYWLVPLP